MLLPLEYTQSSSPSPLMSTSCEAVSVCAVVGKGFAAAKIVVVASQAVPLPRYVVVERVPGTEVTVVERCSGHDGTWGVKTEYFDNAMKIGRPVFRQMAAVEAHYVSSDCPIAGRHIMQGIREAGDQGKAVKAHPLSLLRRAYGI